MVNYEQLYRSSQHGSRLKMLSKSEVQLHVSLTVLTATLWNRTLLVDLKGIIESF